MSAEAQAPVQTIVLYRHELPTPHTAVDHWPPRTAFTLSLLRHPDLGGAVWDDDQLLLTVANGWARYRALWWEPDGQVVLLELDDADLVSPEPCPVAGCAGLEAAG